MAEKGNAGRFEKGDPRAGRPPGVPNKVTLEVREIARGLVEDPGYLAALRTRLALGTCSPPVEQMIWHYAYCKPKEFVEVTGKDGAPVGGIGVDVLPALRKLAGMPPEEE